MSFIGRLQPASRPGLPTWVVDSTSERDALTEVMPGMPITSDDVGRVCQVGASDPLAFYLLLGVNPKVWSQIGAQMTAESIKQAYESNDDTNALTDSDLAKLGHLAVRNDIDLDAVASTLNALSATAVTLAQDPIWDASTGRFPGGARRGGTYIVGTAGTVDGVDFAQNDRVLAVANSPASDTFEGNWFKLDYTDQVLTVAGKTGNVTLKAADIAGLGALAALGKVGASYFDSGSSPAGQVLTSQGEGSAAFEDLAVSEAPVNGRGYERNGGQWVEAPLQDGSNNSFGTSRGLALGAESVAARSVKLQIGENSGENGGDIYCLDNSRDARILFGASVSRGNYGVMQWDRSLSALRFFTSANPSGLVSLESQGVSFYGPTFLGAYTVGTLPTSPGEGAHAFATNGRRVNQPQGGGTGVPVYWSDGSWRRYGDSTAVLA